MGGRVTLDVGRIAVLAFHVIIPDLESQSAVCNGNVYISQRLQCSGDLYTSSSTSS